MALTLGNVRGARTSGTPRTGHWPGRRIASPRGTGFRAASRFALDLDERQHVSRLDVDRVLRQRDEEVDDSLDSEPGWSMTSVERMASGGAY